MQMNAELKKEIDGLCTFFEGQVTVA